MQTACHGAYTMHHLMSLAKRVGCCLIVVAGVATSAVAIAQTVTYKPVDIDTNKSVDQSMRDINASVAKIGKSSSSDSRCSACPSACETVCPANDSKCIAELTKHREAAFAACKKKK